MITLKNRQRKINIDLNALLQEVQATLDFLKYSDFDIGILITTNKTIQTYNKQYRHQDKPTDILSFPFYPYLKAGERIKTYEPEEKNLGDLILSAEYIYKDAENYSMNFKERLRILVVHGVCHLLGYDHVEDKDFRRMQLKEKAILKHLKQVLDE